MSLERTISERLAEASEGFKRHIPRTNSVEEPPCYDTFTSDKQRLRDRLEMYSLCEREVKGDGNCQVLISHALALLAACLLKGSAAYLMLCLRGGEWTRNSQPVYHRH